MLRRFCRRCFRSYLSLPTVAEVLSSAVVVQEAVPIVAPLTEVETVIVGMVGLIETGSELPVDSLISESVAQYCSFVDVGVVVPELSPVVSARAAAVLMSLPAIAEVVSSAVFVGGGGGVVADAAPLTDVGTVTAGVSVLTDAGSELPADFAGVAAVRAAPLAEAREVTLDVVGLDVGEFLCRTDSDDDLPPMVAGHIAMSEFLRSDVVPVGMVDMPTAVLGDDRFSPGVTSCIPLDRPNCMDHHGREHWKLLEFGWDCSVACLSDCVGALDHPVKMPLLDGVSMAHPTYISVQLHKSDTVLDRGSPRLDHPIIPHIR